MTQALAKIPHDTEVATNDPRPKIRDLNSGSYMLVDTGAACSVWPRADYPQTARDVSRGLKAVNNTTLPSYGAAIIDVRLDRKNYTHTFFWP